MGFTQIIGSDKSSNLPDKYAAYFKHIEQAGWQLLSIVENINDLSNISKGKYEVTIELVDLNKILSDKLTAMDDLAKSFQVECSYDISALNDNTIFTDEKHFNKILDNLITNAIEYNIKSGTVQITVLPAHDNFIRIEIENTGPGIQENEIELMFKPFSRISKYRINEVSGIGLVFVKELVELLGGKVGVYSIPNVKTVFWFTLPNMITA